MSALSVLKDKGWFVSENTLDVELDLCDQADRLDDPRRLEEFLLNTDLKEVGNPILYEKFDRKKGELIGPIILQLTKWRNISYPSVSNHDKNDGICVLTLSDGHGSVKCFSIDPLKIDGNTTYGSKILLSGKIRAESGFLMLNSRNTTLLGGNVETLVEKWKTEKFSGNERKSINAPRWVPFSKARNLNIKFDKTFSSLRQNVDSAEKEVDEKTAQFNAARQAQIEALDVPIPKPIKELNENMKNFSLNDPQSSRQQRNDGSNQQNQPPRQQRNDNFNQQKQQFNQQSQDRGNFRNERGRRGGSARGNSDNRPQRNERQFDSQRRPQTDYHQPSNRPDNRPNTQNQGYFQSDAGESFPREFHRGNNSRGNSSRGNNRGRGGGRQTRGSQSGRQQNPHSGNQQQQYQRSGGMQLNIDLDFPSL